MLGHWSTGTEAPFGKLQRPENSDLAHSTHRSFYPTKSPEQRVGTPQYNLLVFKVKVYPNVQCACLISGYSALHAVYFIAMRFFFVNFERHNSEGRILFCFMYLRFRGLLGPSPAMVRSWRARYSQFAGCSSDVPTK